MNILAVIPARYGSTRFPAKMLAPLKEKPLIQWVWEGVRQSTQIARTVIATDDERIFEAAIAFGAEVAMTSPDHPSGTDRVAEVARIYPSDWVINVQGDEPLIQGQVLDAFISELGPCEMATLARSITSPEEIQNPNIVKVVTDHQNRALYFSRLPIPYDRDRNAPFPYLQHLGIYAYRPETLQRLVKLPPSFLELAEKLEQLRALQNGIAIQVLLTSLKSVGVDTPEDLKLVEQLL